MNIYNDTENILSCDFDIIPRKFANESPRHMFNAHPRICGEGLAQNKLETSNSRRYDSYTGRFISADGYVSTGQGLTGYNMYAYCGVYYET